MEKEDENALSQLIKTLKQNTDKLEDSYELKDVEEFNKIKKLMLRINKEILIKIKWKSNLGKI